MPAIKEEELAEQTSRFAISEKRPRQKPASPGFFSPHSHGERLCIKETVKKIAKAVTIKDLKPGTLYVAKSAGSRFIKVGSSSHPNESRPQEVAAACGVAFEKTYQTTPIYCAFRAEQIVHDILVEWAHDRLECKCGKVNREWYRRDFGYIIALVNLIHTWIAQEPYDSKGTKALKDEWKEALSIWNRSQDTTKPLSWPEFFLMGLELHLLPKPLPTSSPLARIHKSASMTDISSPTTPYPWSRRRSTSKPSQFRPRSTSHAYGSSAGLQSGGSKGLFLFPDVNSIPRRPSMSRAPITPSEITSQTAPDASPFATSRGHFSSTESPLLGWETSSGQSDADDRGETARSADFGGVTSDIFPAIGRLSITVEHQTTGEDTRAEEELITPDDLTADEYLSAEEDMTERDNPTVEEVSRAIEVSNAEEVLRVEQVPRQEDVPTPKEVLVAQDAPRAEVNLKTKMDPTAEDDPTKQEVSSIMNHFIGSQDYLDGGESADEKGESAHEKGESAHEKGESAHEKGESAHEKGESAGDEGESADDEVSDSQDTSTVDEDLEFDTEFDTELMEELNRELIELAKEAEEFATSGEGVPLRLEEALTGEEPGLVDEDKNLSQQEVLSGIMENDGTERPQPQVVAQAPPIFQFGQPMTTGTNMTNSARSYWDTIHVGRASANETKLSSGKLSPVLGPKDTAATNATNPAFPRYYTKCGKRIIVKLPKAVTEKSGGNESRIFRFKFPT